MRRSLTIFIDGACRGNPGPASTGVIIFEDNKEIKRKAQPIGEATNNIAEYSALMSALTEAQLLNGTHLLIHTDSELLYNQLKGVYKIKNPTLAGLFEKVKALSGGFKEIVFKRIPREQNQEADKIASEVLTQENQQQAKVVTPTFNFI